VKYNRGLETLTTRTPARAVAASGRFVEAATARKRALITDLNC
jgi:hypothetical protein